MSGCAAARNFTAVLSAKMQTPLTLSSAARIAARSHFGIYRTACAFQLPRGVVAIDADQQRVAETSRRFEIRNVAEVQDVEAAIGDDEFFAGRAEFFPPRRQLVPRDDFVAEVHGVILPARRRLAMILKRDGTDLNRKGHEPHENLKPQKTQKSQRASRRFCPRTAIKVGQASRLSLTCEYGDRLEARPAF